MATGGEPPPMAEAHWEDLRGSELRYRDRTWVLTGDVEVLENGDLLAVEANQADDVRGERALLYFAVRDPPDSLNPGNVGTHFDSLERVNGGHDIVIRAPGRTYRYGLQRVERE